LKLIRVPNLATAIADPLAGFLIAGGFYQYENLPLGGWLAIASSLCLYAGGMVQNDVVDLQIDQTERPHRPLPSKRVSFELAQVVSIGLLLSGVVLACVASVSMRDGTPAVIGVMLTAVICGYNCYAKGTWLGPLFMGGCRALNWSPGMVIAGSASFPLWMIPCGMGVYVMGITLFARDEAGVGRRPQLFAGALIMSIGLLVAGLAPLVSMEVEAANVPHWLVEGRLIAWLALWGVLGVSILIRCVQAIINPVPQRMQSAVGNAIMSLITLDAVLVLAFCGEQWAVSVLALLVWFVLGRRIAAVT
jgi:4-hydroxybenzoate polyprenyltransferase